ncbi:methionine ABC transporter ATP-binding protein [Telmatospirillum sp.]|uniref:methionine ABC transporter ATP-binding protein n=1 Tax=Telmatospirillum sp. TaxID=2079197 RepID=UPI00283EF880|nr:methionine ABC transporter ATP-binding protein [Telmatospirillum sp.]MDR3436017.1 methionine ABC transporter ATP-binding protein [Telmatospirillum sp.]
MIEIDGLVKTFATANGTTTVLKDVSLSIQQGEIFGIIGRSGAGKSTLVRCVNMLERPTAGRVVVDGREISSFSGHALREARRGIGMIFQHFNLLSSRTAYGNVALPLELAGKSKAEIRREIQPLLELVGLTDKQDHYPAELSGGQKQRVGIARALASKPAVLLCDEATSALDPETTQSILALLKDINRTLGLTIMLITHEMPVIKEICDRVAVLDHGEIVEQGQVFDVFTAPKADVTRSFVRDVIDRPLPAHLSERLQANAPASDSNAVLRIIFTGPSAETPVIADVIRHYDVMFNILQGNVEYIQGSPYGNLVVEAIGQPQAVQNAIDYIRSNNLRVEVLGHVADAHRAVA